jgi:hypothetical protein
MLLFIRWREANRVSINRFEVMKVIQPNCRAQFTAADVAYIAAALGRNETDQQFLAELLADETSRDALLDDARLFQRLLEDRGCLRVSAQLYFYVMVRHVLVKSGVTNRDVADYVAELLAEFSQAQRLQCQVAGQVEPMEYFFEMLAALQRADDRTNFLIRAHIGNYSLFLAGVFHDRIRWRAQKRGFPDVSYYEELGRMSFRVASDHRLARQAELSGVYSSLSETFHETRLALNDLSERVFSLGGEDTRMDNALRGLLSAN